mmetsp:Transcript_20337/g.42513  ORF Transcript_20337/g.42513 Transcript_20337/m.42513 type:complete len:84 (-) Transcript_20337:1556-1807(-)
MRHKLPSNSTFSAESASKQRFGLPYEAPQDDPHSSRAVIWLSSGRAFMIRDHDALATMILPRFFNQSKMESFARKLNRWGFGM